MDRIFLGQYTSENIDTIRQYFDESNLRLERVHPENIIGEIAFHLNRGARMAEAIELFYGASKLFDHTDYLGEERLHFRDDCTRMLSAWLKQDFRRNVDFTPHMTGKIYGIFANFEFRMPESLHHFMKDRVREKDDLINRKQAERILSYYARTADILTPDIFDIAGVAIARQPGTSHHKRQVRLYHHLAILDSLNGHRALYDKCTPRALAEGLVKEAGVETLQAADPMFYRIAEEWFSGQPHFAERSRKAGEQVQALRDRLASHGVQIQDAFRESAEGAVRNGVDFYVAFEDARVGVIYDTRTSYVAAIDQKRTLEPNGKLYISSVQVNKANPDDVVVRLSNLVAKNIASGDLGAALKHAAHLKPGVYGMNSHKEVVPLSHLTIEA